MSKKSESNNISLNEEVMKVVSKHRHLFENISDKEAKVVLNRLLESEEKESFTLYYTNENNDDKEIKKFAKLGKIKKFTLEYMNNKSKLKDTGATQVYALADKDDTELFISVLNDDGTWETILDNWDAGLDPIYRNTLLNQVYDSLVGMPYDIMSQNPELKKNILLPIRGHRMTIDEIGDTEDCIGYSFNDNGDAIIRIYLGTEGQKQKVQMIKDVSDHYGVEYTDKGGGRYEMVVPDQEKYL